MTGIRALTLGSALAIGTVNAIFIKAVPSMLLARGESAWLPAWLQLLPSNVLVILLAWLLIDLARESHRQHKLSAATLMLFAIVVPMVSVIPGIAGPVTVIAIASTAWAANWFLACRGKLPFRVYHALAWYIFTAALALWTETVGSTLPWPYTGWLSTAVEVSAILTAIACFAAWGTPLKSVKTSVAIAALLSAVCFGVLLGIGGYSMSAALLEVSGLPLIMHSSVYTIALFLLATTVLNVLSDSRRRVVGFGLLLMLLGSFNFGGTDGLMLSVAGLAVLTAGYPARERSLLSDWRDEMTREWKPAEPEIEPAAT